MKEWKQKEIHNLQDLKKICFDLVKDLQSPQIILLEGPLAVGKSQVVKYMASALGFPKDKVCSPTFSLINVYKKQNKETLCHADLYRLKTEEEVESILFWDMFDSTKQVFIEWPQLVKNKLPRYWNKLFIHLDFCPDKKSRIFKWEWQRP